MASASAFSEPPWLAAARRYLGTSEAPDSADNPVIAGFFRRATGRAYPDSTAWCAAFVGACLAEAGLRGTGSLLARSYLDYGTPLSEPRPGCIVVLSRGRSAWQGHVGFYVGRQNDRVAVLGGNQADRVSVAHYPAARVLGYRWPDAAAAMPDQGTDIRALQRRLIELGYHETGAVDGIMGARTRAALLAFKADQNLPLNADLDRDTLAALARSDTSRPVSLLRAGGKPDHSRIIASSRANIATSLVVGTGSVMAGLEPVLSTAEQAAGMTSRLVAILHAVAELLHRSWPFVAVLGAAMIIFFSRRAIAARIADYRSGRTP